jgi:hypothetical protein
MINSIDFKKKFAIQNASLVLILHRIARFVRTLNFPTILPIVIVFKVILEILKISFAKVNLTKKKFVIFN